MKTITLTIADESSGLNPIELADFLYLFRAANLALKRVVPEGLHQSSKPPTDLQISGYRSQLSSFSPSQLDAFFDPENAPRVLRIERINKQSPLEVVVAGCAFLIVVGVFLSGGKIALSLTGVKGELLPLGEGIKRLREALGLDRTMKASFGIRGAVIRLNKEEYEALCLQDDSSRDRGGFQRFLIELKSRTNKQTRELHLSEQDLERIFRYKADPRRGGFQNRFNKIFGRHFPD